MKYYFVLKPLLGVVILLLIYYCYNLTQQNVKPESELKSYKQTTSIKVEYQCGVLQFGSFDCRNFRPDFTIDPTGTLPYVSGANFLLFSDFVFDYHVANVVPSEVKDGDVIFVKTDLIDQFFVKFFPSINSKFILITHNSDYSTSPEHKKFLNDSKLIAWFGMNPGFEHPKHIVIPIGFKNPVWYTGNTMNLIRYRKKNLTPWEKRKTLLYVNFSPETYPKARKPFYDKLKNEQGVLVIEKRIDFETYMSHLSEAKFVLCPRGNGVDTVRFYEALLMGAIPVVENSTLYPLFESSTTLVLPDLSKFEVSTLKNARSFIKDTSFSDKILLWETWSNKINQLRFKYKMTE